jgi:hypothetical protein
VRRLVFLDFDGVIMTAASYALARPTLASLPADERHTRMAHERMDPALVANVSALCQRIGADVVLSTSWRGSADEDRERLEGVLWARGLSPNVPVVGQTPRLDERAPSGEWLGRRRGAEIVAWLDRHRPGWAREDVVLLDDDCDMDPLADRWVECCWVEGFDAPRLARALELFRLA